MYQKIATCCYCGTRAALTLKGKERHELSCSSCGAPLHEMKMLPSQKVQQARTPRPQTFYTPQPEHDRYKGRKKKVKKKRSLGQRFMAEVWDVAEDLFDDIFD